MADASGKSGSPTISSIAAPTADIDDEWALDDTEDAAAPAATPSSAVLEAAQEAQKSGSPATEEIDSEWPDDAANAEQLRKPKIPLAPKLPEEAATFEGKQAEAQQSAAAPSSPSRPASEPPISEDSIERFERAASSTSRGAFGVTSSRPPPPAAEPSQPPPAIEPHRTHEIAATETPAPTAPVTSAPVTRESDARATASTPPRAAVASVAGASEPPRAQPSKKGAALVYGLAAAAVAIAGVGLAMRAPGGGDRGTERTHLQLDPATKADSSKPKALPTPVAPTTATPPSTAEPNPTEPSPTEPSAAAPAASADPSPDAERTPSTGKSAAEDTDADEPSPDAAATTEAPSGGAPILVTVHIYPPEAEIYHKGKRLGRSGQQIEVQPGERKLLVLIREGYWPRKLILDGKETTYNIGLRKQADGTLGAAAAPKFTPTTP